jgi:hypothetical protein
VPKSNRLTAEARGQSGSVVLRALCDKQLGLGGCETLYEKEAQRRRAAFALLVFASVESSRVAPG